VDTRERLEAALPAVREMLAGGLITLETITVIRPATGQ
jgi:PII-like signaling protein